MVDWGRRDVGENAEENKNTSDTLILFSIDDKESVLKEAATLFIRNEVLLWGNTSSNSTAALRRKIPIILLFNV